MSTFYQHVNNNEQKMINNLFTIKRSLLDIFNITDDSFIKDDRFTLKINGLDRICGKYKDNKITFKVKGIESIHRYDEEKATKHIRESVVNKMKNQVDKFYKAEYSRYGVEFSFTELTEDVIHDIMLLVNSTNAKVRPKNIERW